MTAFLPANLMSNNCIIQWEIAHSAKSIQLANDPILTQMSRDVLTKDETKQQNELACPKAAGRPCRSS